MFRTVDADTADELWLRAAAWFEEGASPALQSSRCGDTREVLHAALSLSNPRQRWIGSRSPAMNPAFALAEVIWIMNGRNDSALPNYFNPRLPRFAGQGRTYHGAYGFRLRQHFGLDQLEHAYRALSANAESRQIALQIWDCQVDLPAEDGRPRSADIPCNVMALLKVREGHLDWTQIMRSNDLVLGLPHNIVQFTSLQEVMAGWLGVEPGGYHQFADSLHVYVEGDSISGRLEPCHLPTNPESIALPKDKSVRNFERLMAFADLLTLPGSDAGPILAALEAVDVDPPFRNWASVLGADALRRRKNLHGVEAIMSECSNPCLSVMFERWLRRTTTE